MRFLANENVTATVIQELRHSLPRGGADGRRSGGFERLLERWFDGYPRCGLGIWSYAGGWSGSH